MNKLILALLALSLVTATCDATAPTQSLTSKRTHKIIDKKGKCIKTNDKQITKASQKKLAKQNKLAKQKANPEINSENTNSETLNKI